MKNKTAKLQDNADVDMTPMLDIVFILLIFFIVTTSFVKPVAIELNRPLDKPSIEKQSKNAVFSIDANNGVYFSGRLIDLEQVSNNLAMFAAKYEISSVLIKADENSKHNTLMTVMNNIKEYDNYTISLVSN
ncbi:MULTISPECIES: biopolymer transporter ExbD [unclassified Pseudoalteromonas]|uniref:ExbD/TolR family protein n=1 Tax=unclassified Pseudoalteromonas TaxID=194690 RepID=UPI001109A211|nr:MULTISPECIES: biopolymer transporter ExbD [unclassified Pseudoalteromonas]TMN79985.1 biopolymer transporter ExbD [Pseudoalteromonas sp. S410]TMN88099.1 biopolymer transporter ExbD [Pseudoalteromonas sp. S408]TMN95103.1 biopolymer transporter ExbD [Pseudoalteromonas sp. S407]TMN97752.1 biopolymer transporter ExbD [Pseudoalteromonas sp. S409]TMO11682.1 biopolymer transporter ExbD [Pseudoalteromonas sp. S186]